MSLKCFSIVAEDIVAVNYFEQNCKAYHLTSREIDIVKLIREGSTYREIGEKLFIAEGTVRKHVEHIFEKTDVSNKIALLRKIDNNSNIKQVQNTFA